MEKEGQERTGNVRIVTRSVYARPLRIQHPRALAQAFQIRRAALGGEESGRGTVLLCLVQLPKNAEIGGQSNKTLQRTPVDPDPDPDTSGSGCRRLGSRRCCCMPVSLHTPDSRRQLVSDDAPIPSPIEAGREDGESTLVLHRTACAQLARPHGGRKGRIVADAVKVVAGAFTGRQGGGDAGLLEAERRESALAGKDGEINEEKNLT